jgi:hypothetical protein
MLDTVKIDRRRKEKVEKFLAALILEEGLKINFQDALGLMIDYSLENRHEIIKRLKEIPPLELDPAWKMLKNPDDWKVEDASEKIDEHIYG